ncbi:4-oxalocrotonate decarboxylase [Lewinellaceae bacterium SD302]|nr:4-oxalocrotonate decarboxylase [Lewinellaceae bacterium SD302]
MLQQETKNEIAATLDEAAFSATATGQISQNQSFDLADAYAIQAASLDRRHGRGEKLTGFKLGFTSKAKMEQMGVHEIIWGRLTDRMAIENGGQLHRSKHIHPRVEPEIAFLIGRPIERALSVDEVAGYLEGVAGALEIIDSRYENFKFSLEDVIADNCSSAAYVLGEWQHPTTDVVNVSIEMKINGELSQAGSSSAILGNPLAALAEITRILSEQKIIIKAGMIILAGAATPAVYVNAGDRIEGTFTGLGGVKLTVK